VTPRSEGVSDAGLSLLMRDGDVDVHAVALRTRDIHSLEVKARAQARRVGQVIIADLAVSEQRALERQHVVDDGCVDDVEKLEGARVGRDA